MFQVMIIAKVSSGATIAVTSQLADLDTKAQADAVCAGVEQHNKGGQTAARICRRGHQVVLRLATDAVTALTFGCTGLPTPAADGRWPFGRSASPHGFLRPPRPDSHDLTSLDVRRSHQEWRLLASLTHEDQDGSRRKRRVGTRTVPRQCATVPLARPSVQPALER